MEIERSGNMSKVIYEALAKYKKNDKLPYTEYFSLGFFETKDLALEAIILNNFLDLESFMMKTFILKSSI